MTSRHVTLSPSLTCRRTRTLDISDRAWVRVARWSGKVERVQVEPDSLDEKDGRTVLSFTDGTWAYTDQIEDGSPAKPGSYAVSHYQSSSDCDEDGWDD